MKRTALKRRSTTSLARLKRKLWELCREITRESYGNTCFTCERTGLYGGNYQTGHFITSSTCSTEIRYSLDNLRVQCYHCNINLSGNWTAFERNLVRDHGREWVDDLKRRNEETKGLKYDSLWYEAKIKEYEKLL